MTMFYFVYTFQDQIDHLTKLKIVANSINSKMSAGDRKAVIQDLRSIRPDTRLLYITPEQASTELFQVGGENNLKSKTCNVVYLSLK